MAKNTIGQFIAALRKVNGLTQQDVADRLNVSNKAVSRWERDECAPDLSVIPALAEMFGVTCDELLKGERISEPVSPERKEPKVDKQVKALINRSLSGFKTLICIALAVACVGIICMFGISYGFYRPVIGFAVMLLFEVCAFALTALAVSKARDIKEYNELFELADPSLKAKFNRTLGNMSFVAFFSVIAVLLLSLPLVLVNPASDYLNSVMTLESYFTFFFLGIVVVLALVWLKFRNSYIAWITEETIVREAKMEYSKSRKQMNLLQIGLTLLAGIIFVFAPYLDLEYNTRGSTPLYVVSVLIGLGCLLANIICFVVFLIKEKEDRKGLVLPGIRNALLIPSALIVSNSHYVGWQGAPGSTVPTRYDSWAFEHFGYAFALAAFVVIVFTIIEVVMKKKRRL